MSTSQIRYTLQRLLRRYRTIRGAEILIMAIAIGVVTYAIGSIIFTTSLLPASVASLAVIIVVAVRTSQLRLFRINEENMMLYINRKLPELQESGDLLLRDPAELTPLEQLQQLRSARQFGHLYSTVSLPNQLLYAVLALVACAFVAAVLVTGFEATRDGVAVRKPPPLPATARQASLPASVNQVRIALTPPAYTGVQPYVAAGFPITAPEATHVSWSIGFSADVQDAQLIFDGKDTLTLAAVNGTFSSKRVINTSGFYQLTWLPAGAQRKFSDYYPITVRKDAPPVLKIDNPDQFIQLEPTDKLSVNMKATLTDDYGLQEAYIIATVSKGSGEAIKFREERLRFDAPARIQGKAVAASRNIDLRKLGLDPGDELYYYIEAFDNRQPAPNRTRTETYFIALRDTAGMATAVDPGLGVDLMPEYFRSQRQIIIDSEKLLKERNSIPREQFNSRSNALAHDEKVLRLRYGEFLGEEFETSIGPSGAPDDHPDEGEDIVKAYGHQHDTDEEHAAHADAPVRPHAHDAGHANPNSKDADPAKAYMHAHDSEEEATFFTQSIRAKLKAAITIMWDAELHLRLYTPEKSLPYQYRALKLLKEISQDSRIYVHRTGFDPPPLKEDKRLTGDLDQVKSTTANSQSVAGGGYPAIRRALVWLDAPRASQDLATPEAKDILLKAGNELSAAALRQPGRYLKALSLLRSLTENELPVAELPVAIGSVRAAFYQVLPANAPHPAARERTAHPLDDAFLRKYDALPKALSK